MPRQKRIKSEYELCSKPVRSVIDRLRSGEVLNKEIIAKPDGGDPDITYAFIPSGQKVRRDTAERAIHTTLVEPSGDGLFGGDTSQTYRATP